VVLEEAEAADDVPVTVDEADEEDEVEAYLWWCGSSLLSSLP